MMGSALDFTSYMPHGYCLFWQPWLVILYAGSDLLIFLAYSAIPFALLQVLRRRPDIRFRGLVALFAAFILLCGLTHLVSIVTLWIGVYPLHGALKLVTGLVSATTAIVLFRLVPRIVQIPSPDQLASANLQLRNEIAAHRETLARLQEAHHDLEERVARRTAELSDANRKLRIVTRETVHRSRNLLTIVGSLARQTARGAADVGTFVHLFIGRIDALASATAAVMADASRDAAPLEEVLRRQLDPMLQSYPDQMTLAGPRVIVGTEAAQQISLAAHELATNALKHGALTHPEGSVTVGWSIEEAAGEPSLVLTWQETGPEGGAREQAQDGESFGMALLLRAVPGTLSGSADRQVGPGGMLYRLAVPLSHVTPKPGEPALDEAAFSAAMAAG